MDFPKRLKRSRELKGFSQKDLATILGIGKTTISNYETGYSSPDNEMLSKIADILEVTTDYLLGRNEDTFDINKSKFVKENIDLIRGTMSYEEMAKDITEKLNAPSSIYTAKNMKKLANGDFVPSDEEITLLARYAEVEKSFFFKSNTYEEYLKEKYVYKQSFTSKQPINTSILPNDLQEFVFSPGSLPYLYFARDLMEKGIDPNDITGFQLKYSKNSR